MSNTEKLELFSFAYHSPIGLLKISHDGFFLRSIGFTTQGKALPSSAEKSSKNRSLEKKIVKQLDAYFAGKLKKFDLPIQLDGTEFENKVWHALLAIPYGQISTYGQVAMKMGWPKACRAVGSAIGKNCLAIIVPCHRVIKGDGSLGGYAWGPKVKQRLILLEKK